MGHSPKRSGEPPAGRESGRSGVQSFYMPRGATMPPQIQRAEGIYYWSESGRRYIDAASGPVAVNIGHGNRRVLRAIEAQARDVSFAFPLSFRSRSSDAFSNALLRMAGSRFGHVYVTSGGSEAVETCLKFARTYAVRKGEPSRHLFISHNPSYHGATLGASSLTGDEAMSELFDPICTPSIKIPAPLSYRQPEGYTAESHARFSLARLEEEIAARGPEKILAFIMEPISGLSSGANIPPDFYFDEVRRICTKYGVILIYDEVLTGGGRTGAFLAAHHWLSAKPDLVALSKGISAGYLPVGAMLAPSEMVDVVAESGGFPHGQTYTTTPLACAAGVAILREIEELDLAANAQTMGALLKQRLEDIARESPIVGDVRGRGLLLATEFVADKVTKEPLPVAIDTPARLGRIAMEKGLVFYPRRTNGGRFGDWLMVTPPLIINESQVFDMTERFERALGEYVEQLVREGVL